MTDERHTEMVETIQEFRSSHPGVQADEAFDQLYPTRHEFRHAFWAQQDAEPKQADPVEGSQAPEAQADTTATEEPVAVTTEEP